MATALELCQQAFRELNFDQVLTSFSTTQAYPYNIARDCLNNVIRYINRQNKHAHLRTEKKINGSGRAVVSVYEFTPTLNPRKIIDVWLKPSSTPDTTLQFYNYPEFLQRYPDFKLTAGKPEAWSHQGDEIYTNVVANADYGMTFYFQQAIPLPEDENEVLDWPEHDMDILSAGLVAYIALRIQREDAGILTQLFERNLRNYFTAQYKNLQAPIQMPRRF